MAFFVIPVENALLARTVEKAMVLILYVFLADLAIYREFAPVHELKPAAVWTFTPIIVCATFINMSS